MFMDLNQEIRSFTPIDIEKYSQENLVSEKTVDSVKAYNKAIEYLKTGSEDIAMIELKRVIAVNPDFYEAVNLLGLCYAYTNQLDKAQELFGKVLNGENNVLKAADYLNYISAGDGSSRKGSKTGKSSALRQKAPEAANGAAKKEPQAKKNKEAYKEEEIHAEYILFKKLGELLKKPRIIVAFNLFGIICLALALVFFILTLKDSEDKKIDNEPIANAAVNDNLDKTLAENKRLQEQLDAANLELKGYKLTDQITQVSVLYKQGKNSEAVEKLRNIPVAELSADQKKSYDSIKKDIYQKEASTLYTQGNALYNSKKYAEAIEKLERVFQLGDKWTFGDKALYILGKSYVEHVDMQKGAEAYQKLIAQYPKSSYVKYAKSRLNAIQ
jgi:TolA-binding protein